jgi:hypothetical protein
MADDEEEKDEDPQLEAYWDEFKENLVLARMTDDEIRQFVLDYCNGQLFTSEDVKEPKMILSVFMPLALGGFAAYNPESLKQIGLFYEHMSKAGYWAINGCPTFGSVKILHKDDWTRAIPAINAELERRKTIPV